MGVSPGERYGVGLNVDQVATDAVRIEAAGEVARGLPVIVPEDEGSLCAFEATTAVELGRAAQAADIISNALSMTFSTVPPGESSARRQRARESARTHRRAAAIWQRQRARGFGPAAGRKKRR